MVAAQRGMAAAWRAMKGSKVSRAAHADRNEGSVSVEVSSCEEEEKEEGRRREGRVRVEVMRGSGAGTC